MIDRCSLLVIDRCDRCADDCFLGEMIDKMTIMYNRQRQAVITNELVEIISGAAALK